MEAVHIRWGCPASEISFEKWDLSTVVKRASPLSRSHYFQVKSHRNIWCKNILIEIFGANSIHIFFQPTLNCFAALPYLYLAYKDDFPYKRRLFVLFTLLDLRFLCDSSNTTAWFAVIFHLMMTCFIDLNLEELTFCQSLVL